MNVLRKNNRKLIATELEINKNNLPNNIYLKMGTETQTKLEQNCSLNIPKPTTKICKEQPIIKRTKTRKQKKKIDKKIYSQYLLKARK